VVCSVVLSREVILPIRSLRFKCSEGEGDSLYDINRFINAALERRIENLELDMVCWPKDLIKTKLSVVFSVARHSSQVEESNSE